MHRATTSPGVSTIKNPSEAVSLHCHYPSLELRCQGPAREADAGVWGRDQGHKRIASSTATGSSLRNMQTLALSQLSNKVLGSNRGVTFSRNCSDNSGRVAQKHRFVTPLG
jgi:hypothetical protein